ncbi:MAG TPA: hypothetical protein VFN35_21265 [Ktedonobacteraceae bacterium]|nr:hypothetical protein [Ktedonobacteraceae bacterium]
MREQFPGKTVSVRVEATIVARNEDDMPGEPFISHLAVNANGRVVLPEIEERINRD